MMGVILSLCVLRSYRGMLTGKEARTRNQWKILERILQRNGARTV